MERKQKNDDFFCLFVNLYTFQTFKASKKDVVKDESRRFTVFKMLLIRLKKRFENDYNRFMRCLSNGSEEHSTRERRMTVFVRAGCASSLSSLWGIIAPESRSLFVSWLGHTVGPSLSAFLLDFNNNQFAALVAIIILFQSSFSILSSRYMYVTCNCPAHQIIMIVITNATTIKLRILWNTQTN